MKYSTIYHWNIMDALKEGREIYVLDREDNSVINLNNAYVGELIEILNHDNEDNRFSIYTAIETEVINE